MSNSDFKPRPNYLVALLFSNCEKKILSGYLDFILIDSFHKTGYINPTA